MGNNNRRASGRLRQWYSDGSITVGIMLLVLFTGHIVLAGGFLIPDEIAPETLPAQALSNSDSPDWPQKLVNKSGYKMLAERLQQTTQAQREDAMGQPDGGTGRNDRG